MLKTQCGLLFMLQHLSVLPPQRWISSHISLIAIWMVKQHMQYKQSAKRVAPQGLAGRVQLYTGLHQGLDPVLYQLPERLCPAVHPAIFRRLQWREGIVETACLQVKIQVSVVADGNHHR